MNNNIRVGSLFGIPFYLNPSWFLVLGLVTLSYGGELANLFPQLGPLVPWFLGFIVAIALFSSVLAHELGHSFVAMQQGIEVKSITLFLFGGLATLDRESETPLQAFLIAIAGPLVSIVIFATLTIIGANISLPAPFTFILSLLALINLYLGLFNLIPGLPLDGGNILKALVWQITGNTNKGIIFASRVGQAFGWLAVIIGGLGVARITQFGSFWTLLIGWFLLQNAGASAQSAKLQETLSKFTAKDAISLDSPIIQDYLTLREFVNNYVIGKDKWRKFLVVNSDSHLLGNIAIDDLKTIPTSNWNEVLVRELTKPIDSYRIVESKVSLLEVTQILEKNQIKELTVISENGTVLGLLENTSIISLLQEKYS
jgi:Zn-dependent protease/CBS domain-containing protein